MVPDLVPSTGNVTSLVGGEGFEVATVAANHPENNFPPNVGKGVIRISVGIPESDVLTTEGKDPIVGVAVGPKMAKNLTNVVHVAKIKIFYATSVGEGVDWPVKL